MEIDMENKQWPEDEDAVLKRFPKGNPFTVPTGYFDELSQRLQSYVHLEDLRQTDSTNGFTVPTGYFDDLSSNIQSRIAIEDVLSTSQNSFAVPENYFDELSNNIQSRIALEELVSPDKDAGFTVPEGYFDQLNDNLQSRMLIESMAGQPDDAGYSVPEGYFDVLHQQITSRIQLEETVDANNTFTVPEGYFNRLTENILSQTTEKQEAKVVRIQPQQRSIIRKLVSSAAFKYASAACFALIVGLAIYVKQASVPQAGHATSYLHKELSEIPASAIENYLEQQTDATDSEHTVVTQGSNVDANSLRDALDASLDEQ